MNIYRLHIGYYAYYVAAESEEDARKQGEDPDKFPSIHFMPFYVEQVEIPGHTITAAIDEADPLDEIRQALKEKGVKFHPNMGEAKLRELAVEHL